MRVSLFCLLFLSLTGAHAEMYKWVDSTGKMHFGDQVPPISATQIQKKTVAPEAAGQPNLPYVLALAVKNNPVIFYTASNCLPCDEGRVLLKKRGIPFVEKTVNTNEDAIKMKQVSGDTRLPLLIVGSEKKIGFDANRWQSMLTSAGYPEFSQLPANYLHAPAEPAAPEKPKQLEEVAAEPALKELDVRLKPVKGNAPEGFRF